MHVKKDDIVVVISGKDKGKKGKILHAIPKKERIIVEGVNMVTKHQKPTQQSQQGGIIKQEAAIHVSNVLLWDKKANQGVRAGHKVLENGEKVRVSKKTGEVLD
ncbi:ribosomal protein L24 [Alkaliphilus metalliredigens QYMF]|uniref:Large ribosomal subunit protein uL24 n=1 Tax=Alkaliphilus metalliredigens (strain QYMF) TaxID=293826 RepID=RL24_ALKMQ|nr:50S ribosomal protein L24 [Alkaliphilus metalliredigens]A6TWH1.1 RecName: Full=Large ribosomal subunit protein uL24; AltName: Full=50S ribosomal protein L24 [Alkaliphilus metalliredigens QYMF]ABR50539.1 ribosomal protein L24 [Alkaliphilus metalliredigens QYMF]